jgi:hypothetical protein
MDNTELVLKTMQNAGKALKAGEVAEASGIEKNEVEKAMKILAKEEKIISPKRCFWEVKK